MGNLIKANEGQALEVKSSDGTVTRGDNDELVDGDVLHVTSKDGTNKTEYAISLGTLSGDAVLTSTEYTITQDGSTGTVAGIPPMTTLSTVMGNITVPPTAFISVVDPWRNSIPVTALTRDTLVMVETYASDSMYLEVIAEDGTTIVYRLSLNAPDMPFVTSIVYKVNQEDLLIEFLQNFTNVNSFLRNLTPSQGATMAVYDGLNNMREAGSIMYRDDYLKVTDPNQMSVIYTLKARDDTSSYVPGMDASLTDLTYDGTTVGGFDPATMGYAVELASGTTVVPAVVGVPTDDNAVVMVIPAANLDGTEAERTAHVEVVSARGVDTMHYSILFSVAVELSDEKDILSFSLTEQTGPSTINATDHTVAIEVTQGTNVTALAPVISVSDRATIDPASGTARDFTSAVTYTVTAEDGSTQDWTVTVSVAVGIQDVNSSTLTVYSFNKHIFVKLASFTQGDAISVYDLTGKVILERDVTSNLEEISVDKSSGIYVVLVKNQGELHIRRVLLK
jgi:hypothetical protein